MIASFIPDFITTPFNVSIKEKWTNFLNLPIARRLSDINKIIPI